MLPSYLTGWLQSRDEGSLDERTLGTLTAVILSIENRLPVFVGSRIEVEDGEAVIVGPAKPFRIDHRDASQRTTEASSI